MDGKRGNLANGFASKGRQGSWKSVHSSTDGKRSSVSGPSLQSGSSGSIGTFDEGLGILDEELDEQKIFSFEDGGDVGEEESTVDDKEVERNEEENEDKVWSSENEDNARNQRRFRPDAVPEIGEEEEGIIWRVGRGILACSLVGAILLVMISITLPIYLFFAWQLIPVPVKVTKPLYFDYRLSNPTASVSFLSPNALAAAQARLSTPKGSSWVGPRILSPGQLFSVAVTMVLPESDANSAIGMFQVTGELLSIHEDVIGVASQPCMLRFRSMPVRWARRLLLGFTLLAGLSEEDQKLTLRLMENRKEGMIPTTGIRVSLGPKAGWPEGKGLPEIYEAVVTLEAVITPAGMLMRCFRLTGVIWGIGGLFLWELFWVLVCCRSVLFPKLQAEPRRPVPIAAPANHLRAPKTKERGRPDLQRRHPSPKAPVRRKKSPVKSYKDMSSEELLQFLHEDEAELLALIKEGGMKLQAVGGKPLPDDIESLEIPDLDDILPPQKPAMTPAEVSGTPRGLYPDVRTVDEVVADHGGGSGRGVEHVSEQRFGASSSDCGRFAGDLGSSDLHGGSRLETPKSFARRDAAGCSKECQGRALDSDGRVVEGVGSSGLKAVACCGGLVSGLSVDGVGGRSSSSGGNVCGESKLEAARMGLRKAGTGPVMSEIKESESPVEGGWEMVGSEKWKGKRPLGGSPISSNSRCHVSPAGVGAGEGSSMRPFASMAEHKAVGHERDAVASVSGAKRDSGVSEGLLREQRPSVKEKLGGEREISHYAAVSNRSKLSGLDSERDRRAPSAADLTRKHEAGMPSGHRVEDQCLDTAENVSSRKTWGSDLKQQLQSSGSEDEGAGKHWNGMPMRSESETVVVEEFLDAEGSEEFSVSPRSEGRCGMEEVLPVHYGGVIVRESSGGSVECYEDSPTVLGSPGLEEEGAVRDAFSGSEGRVESSGDLYEDAVASLPGQQGISSGQVAASSVEDTDRDVGFLNAKFTFIEGDEMRAGVFEEEEAQQCSGLPTLEVGGVVRVGGFKSLRRRLLRSRDAVGLASILNF